MRTCRENRRAALFGAAILVVTLAGLVPVGAGAFAAPSDSRLAGSSTFAQGDASDANAALVTLADCVRDRRALESLFLIDESASLKDTDPTNARVSAIQTALESLEALRARPSQGRRPSVDVQLAGFSVGYEQVAAWGSLAGSLDVFEEQAVSFAERNAGRDTDYFAALDGARQTFAARDADGEVGACKLLLWFTDGRYDIEDRLPPSIPDVVSKYYAPDIRLDETGGGARMRERGRELLCANGGVVDQLRNDGAFIVPVVLTTDVSPGDQAFLDQIAGGGCGASGSPDTGVSLHAEDLAAAVATFDEVVNSTQGGTPMGTSEVAVCRQQRVCSGAERAFDTDVLVRRFRALVITDTRDPSVMLRPPDSSSVRLANGRNGRKHLSEGDITYRWIGAGTLIIDCKLAQHDDEQRWSIHVLDASASGASTATITVSVFTNLLPVVANEPVFTAGEATEFEIDLRDGARSIPDGVLDRRGTTVTAVVEDPVLRREQPVRLTRLESGRYRGKYDPPRSGAPVFVYLRVRVNASTVTGLELVPIEQTYRAPVRPPTGYPRIIGTVLRLRPQQDGSGARGAMTVRALASPGCVRVKSAEVATFPAGAQAVALTTSPEAGVSTPCKRLAVRARTEIEVTATPRIITTGAGTGSLQLLLRADGKRPITVGVPVAFEFSPGGGAACLDEGVLTANRSGIQVVEDCTTRTVFDGDDVELAVSDRAAGIVFQRHAQDPITGYGLAPIERLKANGEIETIVERPADYAAEVELLGIADSRDGAKVVYRSRTVDGFGIGAVGVSEVKARDLGGNTEVTLFTSRCEEGTECSVAGAPSYGGNVYAAAVGTSIESAIEFRDDVGNRIDVPGNPVPVPVVDGPLDVALSPDGAYLVTVAYGRGDAVIWRVADGTEVKRVSIGPDVILGMPRRLEFDGRRLLVSASGSDPEDYDRPASVVIDTDTGAVEPASAIGLASLGAPDGRVPKATAVEPVVLDPTGLGKLHLGQTVEDARATGEIGDTSPGCELAGGTELGAALARLPAGFATFENGLLVTIQVRWGAQTSAGIRPGISTIDDVEAVYGTAGFRTTVEYSDVFGSAFIDVFKGNDVVFTMNADPDTGIVSAIAVGPRQLCD